MIAPTYENVQLTRLLAAPINKWLDGMTPTRRRLFIAASSGNYRTYTAVAASMGLSVTRITKLMGNLRRGGGVVLRGRLNELGLPVVYYDVTWCPWGTLAAIKTILDLAGNPDSCHQTQQDAL